MIFRDVIGVPLWGIPDTYTDLAYKSVLLSHNTKSAYNQI